MYLFSASFCLLPCLRYIQLLYWELISDEWRNSVFFFFFCITSFFIHLSLYHFYFVSIFLWNHAYWYNSVIGVENINLTEEHGWKQAFISGVFSTFFTFWNIQLNGNGTERPFEKRGGVGLGNAISMAIALLNMSLIASSHTQRQQTYIKSVQEGTRTFWGNV